jgi:hypothetical protein
MLQRVLACLFCLALALPAHADLAAFVAEVVAAHGGGEAPLAIHEQGTTTSLRRGAGPMERWWQGPAHFRIDIAYPAGGESRLLNGTQAWQQGQPATMPLRGAVLLQAARMALPWRLRDNLAALADRGTVRDSDGQSIRVIEWSLADGLRVLAEVDAETRLLKRSRGIMTVGGSTMEFATRYEQYRQFGGRQVATLELHFAMGQFIGRTSLDAIEFPERIAAGVFAPPADEPGRAI